MSTTQVQWRRGSAAQNAIFLGALGEISVDTGNSRICVHDGFTVGGWTGAKIQDLTNQNITYAVYQTGNQNISGVKYFQNGSDIYISGQSVGSKIQIIANGPQLYIGSGSPEGILSAISGSIYTDWYNKTLYQKITGVGVNGWN